MTKVTRKLLLSLFSVVLTVVALGATTFAWFTITNVASVQAFDADFKANQGIEIALGDMDTGGFDDLDWVTNLTADAIYAYIASTHLSVGQTGFEFDHVTSINGRDFNKITPTSGGFTFTSVSRNGAGYIEIPLHFRSDTAEGINLSALDFQSPLISWRVDVPFYSGYDTELNPVQRVTGSSINAYAHDAIRMSYTQHNLTWNGTSFDEAFSTVVYEKPASETNMVLGGGTLDLTGTLLGLNGEPGAMNYFYAKNNILPEGTATVTVPATEQILAVEGKDVLTMLQYKDAEGELLYAGFDPGANYYGKVTLRIWVEGWDANAYNSILGSRLTVSMSFTGRLGE